MFKINFEFFNVESIRVFTSTFVVICYANPYPYFFNTTNNEKAVTGLRRVFEEYFDIKV